MEISSIKNATGILQRFSFLFAFVCHERRWNSLLIFPVFQVIIMQLRTKQSYHPFVVVAFYLHILPEKLLLQISRSTRHEWEHKSVTNLFGYDWYCNNQHCFDTLKNISANKRLLQVNKALLRIIAIQQFIKVYKTHINHKIFNAATTVLQNIHKTKEVLGLPLTLKLLRLTYQQYWQLKQKIRCQKSLYSLCLVKHPTQLLPKEAAVIKKYCEDVRYLYWPLASVYYQIIRAGLPGSTSVLFTNIQGC